MGRMEDLLKIAERIGVKLTTKDYLKAAEEIAKHFKNVDELYDVTDEIGPEEVMMAEMDIEFYIRKKQNQ